jgi:GT2 family glycosyltransferase
MHAEKPDLSIVIINHHHSGIIERSIESLMALPDKVTFELLVIDNTPSDNLGDWLNSRYPDVTIHKNLTPLGYAANANLGLRTAARGRYAMMLNPDVICLPGLLDKLVEHMDRNPAVALTAPTLLNLDGSLQPSCRRFPTPLTLAIRFARLDSMFPGLMAHYLMEDWDHAAASDVDWVTGAVVVFRRDALQAVAWMDESYFMYWEDLDLCLRLWHAGWHVSYLPDARATHAHLRQGVKTPLSKFGLWQMGGAVKIFRRFGVKPSRQKPR